MVMTARTEAIIAALLSRVLEVSEDAGTATGGSQTTLEDTTKNWETDMWQNATIHVFHDGIEYLRLCSANTADTITFAALPAGISVATGDSWAVRRPVTVADISDRAARLVGIIYGNVDQLQQTVAKNLKASVEEQAIALGIDVQARYPLKTIRDIAPGATGTFWLPETGNIDLSNFISSSWYIYAPTTATMTVNCYLNISHDGGITWRRAEGYEILDADFVRDVWNSIHCPLMLAEAKLEVVIGVAAPAELDLMCIRKA